LFLPITLGLAAATVLELRDPHLRVAILEEQGALYVSQAYATAFVVFTAPLLAMVLAYRRIRAVHATKV
jgi:hypothetical protein